MKTNENNDVALRDFNELRESNSLLKACYRCSLPQKRLIEMAVATIQREEVTTLFGKQTSLISKFKITDFIEKYDLAKGGEVWSTIRTAVKGLIGAHFKIETDNFVEYWNWFERIHCSNTENFVEFEFTKTVGNAILELKEKYGIIDVAVTRQFKSFYASKFYDYAISKRNMQGKFFDLNEQQIREFLGIGDKYKGRMDNFERKIIISPLKEINEIIECDFTLEWARIKDRRTTVGWRFTIHEKNRKKVIKSTDTPKTKQEKRNFNDEQAFAAEHSEEIGERMKFYLSHPDELPQMARSKLNSFAELYAFGDIAQKYGFKAQN